MAQEKQQEKGLESPTLNQWKSSQEYKEYERLKNIGKLKEAEAIKKDTIKKITKEALREYLDSFSEIARSSLEKSVNELPDNFQILIADLNIKIKNNLAPGKTQKDINNIDIEIMLFAESILYGKGQCVKSLNRIMKRAPELKDTPLMNNLLDLGQKYDEIAELDKNIEGWTEVIEMLKKY